MMRHSAANGRGRGNSDSRISPPGRRLNTVVCWLIFIKKIIILINNEEEQPTLNQQASKLKQVS
jgi:hypothetical protein